MLIKCPECQCTVSDSAEACPHCGFGVKAHVSHIRYEKEEKEKKEKSEKALTEQVQKFLMEREMTIRTQGYAIIAAGGCAIRDDEAYIDEPAVTNCGFIEILCNGSSNGSIGILNKSTSFKVYGHFNYMLDGHWFLPDTSPGNLYDGARLTIEVPIGKHTIEVNCGSPDKYHSITCDIDNDKNRYARIAVEYVDKLLGGIKFKDINVKYLTYEERSYIEYGKILERKRFFKENWKN